MKRMIELSLTLALLAVLAGCNTTIPISGPTQPAGITPIGTGIPTPEPTVTGQPAGVTPTYPEVPTPEPTGTGQPAGVTPTYPEVPTPEPTVTLTTGMDITPVVTTGPAASFSLEQLKNFTYRIESPEIQVMLKNGEYTGDHVNTLFVQPTAFGDLNGDGKPDAVVILATNLGGSGRFYDLVPVLDQDGKPAQAGYATFGDRQVVKNLTIENGRVILDYMTQGINDPLCCPSQHRLRTYVLENNTLHLASEQLLESPSSQATPVPVEIFIDQPSDLAMIASPVRVSGRVNPVPPEKKMEYYLVDRATAVLMDRGEVPLNGEVGGPGTFSFEITFDSTKSKLYQLEISYGANGLLLGRSAVDLLGQ